MNNNDIKVSVCCAVYNHEKYLRKCLDGFVMQKTNFAFEVLINDDKSTDSSAEIIKDYCEKYPDIFVPVFQTENQYSKGIKINDDILIPMAKGKYVAFCEGDDYWCDENKLQLQYDYMENDENCIMCLHNTVFHYLDGSRKDRLFNNWKTIHTLNTEEVFFDWLIHTSSYFIRKEYALKPDIGRNCWAGDMVVRTWLHTIGKLVALPQVMSVYNYGVKNGAIARYEEKNENKIKYDHEFKVYFEKLNEITDFKFNNVIQKITFDYVICENEENVKNPKSKKEAVEAARSITTHPYYTEFIKSRNGIKRLRTRFKYEGYVIYPIWRLAYLLYYGRETRGSFNE